MITQLLQQMMKGDSLPSWYSGIYFARLAHVFMFNDRYIFQGVVTVALIRTVEPLIHEILP